MLKRYPFIFVLFLFACKSKVEKIKPTVEPISESIYASGVIKSKNQYQAFAMANGIVEEVFVEEGDSVKKGTPILSISNDAQKLNKDNAELAAAFSDINANEGKLNEAKSLIDLAKSKMKVDSALYFRQKNLWQQNIGTKVELEQRELAYQNSKTSYYSSIVRYNDLKRQLNFSSSQSKKNLLIADKLQSDFTLKSEINGIVYSLFKSKGEIVGVQTPIAVIGDSKQFILEMQVDEYDILKIKKGLTVLVTLESYKGKVFEAVVTKINPMMNERSKTFLVEAEFITQPEILYPNISFEANIVIQSKEKAILIPRNFLLNDSFVVKANGDKVEVKTGLKDYQKIEIISGISAEEELVKPTE
ncbi:MAG: efflux RND transporter periplasmic adaptor subunit [Bacteroidia bacterium]